MQTISNIAVVVFDANAITGTVSTDEGRGEAFTSRGVRYISPKALNQFAAIRQATHTELLRVGTRFLSGYAVPADKSDVVADIMARKQALWDQAAKDFLGDYQSMVAEWVRDHPEVEGYQGLFPQIDWVRNRIDFEWTMFQVEPKGMGSQGMSQMIGRLPAQVIDEIVQDVRSSWNPSAQKMNAKTRGILKRVADKLASLSFLGGELGQMASKVSQVLDMLPVEGQFSPSEMATASVVLAMLSSERSAQDLLTLDPNSLQGLIAPAPAPASSFVFDEAEAVQSPKTVAEKIVESEKVEAFSFEAEGAPAPAVANTHAHAEEEEFLFVMG